MRAGSKRTTAGRKKLTRESRAANPLPESRPSDTPAPLQQLTRYCICGATLEIAVVPRAAAQVEEAWRRVHSGPRHRPSAAPARDPLRHADQILAEVAGSAKAPSKRADGDA